MYVCVESELLDVFSSSLLVLLLFAANMATVTMSLKSLLKAQLTPPPPPPPQVLSGSQSYIWEFDLIGLLLPSLTVLWMSMLQLR